jgi:tetratricopeptide (TPR) repeat protein
MTDAQVQQMLQQAVMLLQREDAVRAEGLLSHILSARPAEPDALQLLGTLRRMQRRDNEAETLYRQSLVAKPGQPHVHHNLGNVLRKMGRLDEAVEEQRAAIRGKPNYAEAHLGLGLALSEKRDDAAAEKSIREALRLQPGYLFARQSLAAVLNDLNRPQEAETVLRQTLASGVRDPRQVAALEHNLAISLRLQKRHPESMIFFDAARAKAPDMPLVDYNRGNALLSTGQPEAAAESYHRAIMNNPLHLEAHRDLNHLLYRLGDDANFLRSYDDAMMLYPEQGQLPLHKGHFLFMQEKYEEAQELFERAATMLPDDVLPHNGLGLIHARRGNFDVAIREHEAALKLEPQNAHAWRNFAETLLRAGDAKKAFDAAQESLAIDPHEQGALAMAGTALEVMNDPRGESWNDYENFVQIFEIAPPEGYFDVESFNRDLNRYLDTFHSDKREDIEQTLRGGTQTFENLFERGHDLVERLRARIDEAVAAYIARLKDDENHPLLKRRRRDFGYSASWSSRLHDCGFHTNHIHSKGWISSAYYIDLPEAVEDAAAKQGWIKFGEPAFTTTLKEPIRRTIQPRAGRLVLFPSYMWHGTIPFQSKTARTTIAFDVVPK